MVLFIKEKALHFRNYSHFWMFSVIVRLHYCQSNIYDKVLSAWHVNEKAVVSFGLRRSYFLSLGVAASLQASFTGWCQLQHFSGLSAQSACWKLPEGDAVNIWMGYLTGLSISEWSSLVSHCCRCQKHAVKVTISNQFYSWSDCISDNMLYFIAYRNMKNKERVICSCVVALLLY